MRLRAIPPVRRAVPLGWAKTRCGSELLLRYFGGQQFTVYGSGTQALTAAISECAHLKQTSAPNAIIPAYGCPDLVTACLGADVAPILVDISKDRWGYDLGLLEAAVNADTVAIVAVNLLGLREAESEILRISRASGARVISDCAQHLPRTPDESCSDYQVFSFGRGKPLNLLGGGALVGPISGPNPHGISSERALKQSRIAGMLFNLATLPCAYPWTQLLMAGSVGGTRYREPTTPVVSSPTRQRLSVAMPEYLGAPTYSSAPYLPYLDTWRKDGVTPLQSITHRGAPTEPVRLAMTARTKGQRNEIVSSLSALGLGASSLYGTTLPNVIGIPDVAKEQGPYSNAEYLASRLFTLPTHKQVTSKLAAQIAGRIQDVLSKHQ